MNKKVDLVKNTSKFLNAGNSSMQRAEAEIVDSFELLAISPKNTDSSQESMEIIIEGPKEESQKLLENAFQNGTKKITFSCNKDIEDALNFLKSPNFDDIMEEVDKILLIRFQIIENFNELNSNQLDKMNGKFKNKSVVVIFEAKDDEKSLIYWKSKDLSYFLVIKHHSEKFSKIDEELYEFIVNFLVESLQIGHLGLDKNYQLSDETCRIDIIYLANSLNKNLLFIACENGNADIAAYLLRFSMSIEIRNVTAQQLALDNGHFDVVLKLIEANLTYPEPIDIHECPDKFKEFCQMTQKFHKMIKIDNSESVREIFKHLPKTQHFYSLSNESALKVAVQNKSFECYDFLVSQKLLFGPHEDPEEYFQNLKYDDQRILREIHNKYTQDSPEKHINVLMTKSFLSHDVIDNQKLEIVHKAYRSLNTNPFIKIILMIVAASKTFKIIFDFNRDSVNVSDPTVDSGTFGLFYPSGRIYIGAKQLLDSSTENETLATIAHEFCHFAMNLVYENNAKPYRSNDHQTMQEFEEISKACQENLNIEDVIDVVYELYDANMHHAELIVRVVHLLALYRNNDEKLDELCEIFGRLFDFYEKKIVSELRHALPEIDGRAEKEIEEKDEKISKLRKMVLIAGLLCIFGIISSVIVAFALHKPEYKFNELQAADQETVKYAVLIYQNVEVKFRELFSENSSVYNNLSSEQITMMLNEQKMDIKDPHLKFLYDFIYHDWKNLTEILKRKFLNSNFVFQNSLLKFRNLYEKIPKAFDELTTRQIFDVLDGNELLIGKSVQNSTNFYIDRSFMDEDAYIIYYLYKYEGSGRTEKSSSEEKFRKYYEEFLSQNISSYVQKIDEIRKSERFKLKLTSSLTDFFGPLLSYKKLHQNINEIINKTIDSKFFILSSEAGAGKSITFERISMMIKEMHPILWVELIDIKKYIKKGNFLDQIMDNKNNFEKKIFTELFDSGSVVLLWNGFDDISPDHSELVMVMETLGSIQENTKNIQFVCTRPLYSKLLRGKFNVKSSTLLPLDGNKQDEFLKKFFISKNVENIQIYVNKVKNIINALRPSSAYPYKHEFNTPHMLQLTANLMINPEFVDTKNLYKIYQKIIDQNIEIWYNKTQVSQISFRRFDWMKLFQKFALKQDLLNIDRLSFLNAKKLEIMRLEITPELTYEEISRLGILYISSENDFEFAHKTFVDFFVAQFFIENIYHGRNVDTDEATLILQLFFTVSREYNRHQVMITNFINYYVDDQQNGLFDSSIADIVRTKFRGIFVDFIYKIETDHFQYLFNFFKKDHRLLIDLLHVNGNETFYTATFNCDYTIYSIIKEVNRNLIKNMTKNCLTNEEFGKFIQGQHQKGVILLGLYRLYIYYDKIIAHDQYELDSGIFKEKNAFFALRKIARNLTRDEHIQLVTSPEGIVDPRDIKMIEQNIFWYIAIEKFALTRAEIKVMFTNLFHGLTKMKFDYQYLPLLFNKTEEHLSSSEIFKIISSRNILHSAVHNKAYFMELWNFFSNHTTRNQRKYMLTKKEFGGCTSTYGNRYHVANRMCIEFPPQNIFQVALNPHYGTIYDDTGSSFDYIKNIYQNYFKSSEIREIVTNSMDILPYLIWSRRLDINEAFGRYIKVLFNRSDDLRKILLQKIQPTNLTIFEYIDDSEYADVLKIFSNIVKSENNN